MKTLEATRSSAPHPFHDTVEELWRGDDEAVRARVMDWALEPSERIRSQLETLADVYQGRSDRQTMRWRGATHEFTEFATRDDACTKLDEIYTIHDTYSVAAKDYRRREYAVDLFLDDAHHRLVVSADDELTVFADDGHAMHEVLDEEERETIVTDFFFRSLVAAVRNEERTDDERAAADTDAQTKLHLRRYGGPKVTSATE